MVGSVMVLQGLEGGCAEVAVMAPEYDIQVVSTDVGYRTVVVTCARSIAELTIVLFCIRIAELIDGPLASLHTSVDSQFCWGQLMDTWWLREC